MAYEENGVVWKRTNGYVQEDYEVAETNEDIWDDTALIDAYDKAVQKLKEEIATDDEKPVSKKNSYGSTSRSTNKGDEDHCRWEIGQKCMALYFENELWYCAVILDIYLKDNVALVEFDWFNNKEEVSLADLLPIEMKEEMEQPSLHEEEGEEYEEESEDDASMTSPILEKSTTNKINWKVSDICYVPDGKGNYTEAVLNSFVSSSECMVTFIGDRSCKQMKVSTLSAEKPPSTSFNRCQTPLHNSFSTQQSAAATPPPFNIPQPPLLSSSGGFNSSLHQIQAMFGLPPLPVHNSPYTNPPHGGASMNPQNYFTQRYNTTPAPPPPPPPVLNEEIIRGDEEALANMLMSWYMNGYHTGYYRGLQQNRSKESKKK